MINFLSILRVIPFLSLLILCSCQDWDLFGGSLDRTISGAYGLHYFETGEYYINGPGGSSSGGVLRGTVVELGWGKDTILAKRKANFGGDPDGWMVIDVPSQKIKGPVSENERSTDPLLSKIKTYPPETAWKILP